MMHDELVEKKRWISERRFLHALNYCMLLPGPEAQQLATYLGWLMHRTWGGILAGTLFILPSLLILIALSWIYLEFGQTPLIAALFEGIKPAVTAIVIVAVIRIAKRSIRHAILAWLAFLSFVAIFVFNVPFPLIIVSAGLIGFWLGQRRPTLFAQPAHTPSHHGDSAIKALIDDKTPTPEHARHDATRLYRQLSIGILLWLIPIVALTLIEGWKSLYPQLAWFFSKAAFLTFGGAYAVLPYVFQGAVEHYQWLTAPQMMDGLALGETKPGPLIMVVAFVGFLAGFANDTVLGGLGFWGGALGAFVATWFTFLPSFLFIFLGAPLIESTHGNLRFTAPLTAISAAVVGVIANLGVFFAYQVFFPKGFSGGLSVFALLVCLGSLVLMLRLQWGVIRTLGLAGLLGILFATNGRLLS